MSEYPTEGELDEISNWTGKFEDLMKQIEGIWHFPEWGWSEDQTFWYISTGGWSGNEDIIRALESNPIWKEHLVIERRGGHYKVRK